MLRLIHSRTDQDIIIRRALYVVGALGGDTAQQSRLSFGEAVCLAGICSDIVARGPLTPAEYAISYNMTPELLRYVAGCL